MSKVRIAAQLHPQHAEYSDIRDAVSRAEEGGFDIVYNWDHFFPLYGDSEGKHLECWTMLGAWAEQTTTIEFGALVTCNSYRNAQLLADMARTVDHISGGRLILGIGAGWFERDYEEYGYPFGTAPDRLRDLRRSLPLIEERWAMLNPPPTRDIPVLIGGAGEKVTLRLVARHADAWHFFPRSLDQAQHKISVMREWCEKEERDPAEIEISAGVSRTKMEDQLGEADALYDLGVRQFTFGFNGPDYELSRAEGWLQWRDEKNG